MSRKRGGCGCFGLIVVGFFILLLFAGCGAIFGGSKDEKKDEPAPSASTSQSSPESTKVTMPKVTGMTLRNAETLIKKAGYDLSIQQQDVTPDDRGVWDSDNWIVCSQSPQPNVDASKVDVTLTYGRDAAECKTKKSKEAIAAASESAAAAKSSPSTSPEATYAIEKTSQGLTEESAKGKCFDSIVVRNPGLEIAYILGHHSMEIIDPGDGWGDRWEWVVDVKRGKAIVGTLYCEVGGTEESPLLYQFDIR